MTDETTIRRVECMDILEAPNALELFAAYAEDCLMPGAEPEAAIYQGMEHAGVLGCFGAYAGEELVGFATVVTGINPHNGKRMGMTESLYVFPEYRNAGTGAALLQAAKSYAREVGCALLQRMARVGSALESMSAEQGLERTHSVFTEWL